jgi:dihydrolipoamide dehydrogenase
MAVIEVKVPDIGDFSDVPVIEVFVKAGDVVKPEDSLVTLESDKATMDVPSPSGGTVKEVKVKVGDKLSEGSVVLTLETTDTAAAAKPAPASAARAPDAPKASAPAASAPAPGAATFSGTADIECEMLVLGSGPGGYSAAFRSADLGMKTVLVERYATLGGVCLNVGCIPSKALLHIAAVMDEVAALGEHGVAFGAPKVDLAKLLAWKNKVVGKLTGGLTGMAKSRKVEVVRGYGTFLDPHHVVVEVTEGAAQAKTGAKQIIRFQQAIIAAGSQSVNLPFVPDDPRIVDSTGALELKAVPKRMLVVGGGIIGLEMGTVYSSLGARLDVVEMHDSLMQGADRDLVKVWEKMNKPRFDRVMLKTKTVAVEAKKDAVYVTFEGEQAPAGAQPYDLVLLAAGRRTQKIGADKASHRDDRALFPPTISSAPTCRTSMRSATSSGSRCSRTRPHTRAMSPPKQRLARSLSSTRASFLRSPTRIRRSRGSGSRRTRRRPKASRCRRACSRGPHPAAPSPTAGTRVSPNCCSTPTRTASSVAVSSARMPAT